MPKSYEPDYNAIKTNGRPLSEIGDVQPIEVVNEKDFKMSAAEGLKFMNEIVEVRIFNSSEEGSDPVPTYTVEGINQPIIRGVWTPVKRKYVESMARTRRSRTLQSRPDPSKPEQILTFEEQSIKDPFEIRDKNPIGAAWLNSIMSERM